VAARLPQPPKAERPNFLVSMEIKNYSNLLMHFILNKPYKVIWRSIPFLIGLSLIGWNKTIDIQMHDTYFVIALFHVGIFFSIILTVLGSLYWLVRNKQLINWITIVHVIITIASFFMLLIGPIFNKGFLWQLTTITSFNHSQYLLILILIWLIAQLFFFLNLIFSFIRNLEK